MLSRYKANLIKSIRFPQEVKDVLNYGEEDEFNKLLKAMDDGIVRGLSSSSSKDYSDLSKLNQQARNIYKNTNFNQLDKVSQVIEVISEGAKLLTEPNSNELSALISQYKGNLQGLNGELTRLLTPAKDGTIIGLDNQALNTIAFSLNNIIEKTLSGEKISVQSMSSYLNNIFATGLGEGIIAKGIALQVGKTSAEIDDYLTGTLGMSMAKDTKGFYDEYKTLPNATFKPDVQADNFQFSINDEGETISINLGVSVKTYNSLSKSASVSIVTGKSFTQILDTIFSDGLYYVYNTLGLLDASVTQYRDMKAAIVANFADNLLSGTGIGRDFSQYMVINGQYYPIYQILQQVIQFNTGASSSQKNALDPVEISIVGAGDLKTIQNKAEYSGRNSWKKGWNRSLEISKFIGTLKIHGAFYPNRIPNIVIK